ncbi:hypothetical protein [Mycobacterium sp. GA-1841]|uniref:hypothetical protein n=1 Tax=Mycobacterium sp. GA-1841 TaxID=1834154 RepID=UPI00158D41F3|nr:hypothetical protein [Mycobacterium sp. GA-1841]
MLTKDSKPAAAMGQAVRAWPRESEKLTSWEPDVGARPAAKAADTPVALLSSGDPST